jgi:outer membrane receptor protein involved in Fe transport
VGPGEVGGGFFFQETGSYLDAYDPSTPVDGTFGTGNGAVNYVGWNPPSGRMRAPGVPQLIGNLFVEYKTRNGWGIGVGPNFIGKQYANDQDSLYIPNEYELDGYILWVPSKRWDVRLNVTNITNNRILDPIDVSFAGNDVIYVRKPISASGTLRLHF